MEACSNSRRGYNVMCAAAVSYRAGGAQCGKWLGSRDRPNGWGSKSTRFHGPNVVSYKIVLKALDV